MKGICSFFVLLVISCSVKQETTFNKTTDTTESISLQQSSTEHFDTIANNFPSKPPLDTCQQHDLSKEITPNGNFIDYKSFDNKYQVIWGNEKFKRILPDTFYCAAPPPTIPHFEQESKNYVMLGFGCGSPCWGSIYLPLNSQWPVREIMYEYAVDLDNNLVVALDQDESKTFIAVHNLMTGNIQEIKIESTCASAVPTYCLDSLSINGKYLYYRWFTDLDNHITKEYTVKIR